MNHRLSVSGWPFCILPSKRPGPRVRELAERLAVVIADHQCGALVASTCGL